MNFRTRGPIFYLLQAPNRRRSWSATCPACRRSRASSTSCAQTDDARAGADAARQAHRLRPHLARRLVPAGGAGRRPPDRHAARHRARLRMGGRAHAAARHRRRRADRRELPAPHRHDHAHQPRHHGGRSVGAHSGARHPRRDRPAGVEPQRHAEPHPAADGRAAPGHRATSPTTCARRSAACASISRTRASGRPRTADYDAATDAAIAEADELLETFSALLRIAQVEAGAQKARLHRRRSVRAGAQRRRGLPAGRRGFRAQARRTSIEDGVHLTGDRQLLAQMISNLVENALRHTPAGSTVSLALRKTGAGFEIEVADNGPGIPEAEHEQGVRPLLPPRPQPLDRRQRPRTWRWSRRSPACTASRSQARGPPARAARPARHKLTLTSGRSYEHRLCNRGLSRDPA